MENRRRRNNTPISVITSLVVGGVMGWAIGSFITPMVNEPISTGVVPGIGGGPEVTRSVGPYTTNTADFRVELDSLFKEHGVLASEYLKNIHDRKDGAAIKAQLDQNTNKVGDVIGRVYGGEARGQFLEMWNMHIMEYENYAKALRDNNNDAKTRAHTTLITQAEEMGRFLNQLDGNFSAQRITTLMNEHVQLTLNIIEAHAAEDTTALASNIKAAYEQAGEFANYVGQVIFSSRPERL